MSYLPKVYRKQGGNELVVASGGKITVESGGTLDVAAGATLSLGDGIAAPGDIALADGKVIVGNGSNVGAAVTLSGDASIGNTGVVAIGTGVIIDTDVKSDAAIAYSKLATLASARLLVGSAAGVATAVDITGDVTISNAGVTAIGSAKVTNAMLANGAGVGALLTAGLGGSGSVVKTDTLTHTLVAAHATKDRACIVMVVVNETYAVGTGTLPGLVIGEADTTNKAMTAGTLDTEAAGTVLFFAFTNTSTKAITATSTAAVGNATGGCSITVLAIPTT